MRLGRGLEKLWPHSRALLSPALSIFHPPFITASLTCYQWLVLIANPMLFTAMQWTRFNGIFWSFPTYIISLLCRNVRRYIPYYIDANTTTGISEQLANRRLIVHGSVSESEQWTLSQAHTVVSVESETESSSSSMSPPASRLLSSRLDSWLALLWMNNEYS
jgi:hypothetical protein